jgi:pimeloyl-ACP methyl ester carboxylesterase
MKKTIKLLNEDIEIYVESNGKPKVIFFHGFNSSFNSFLLNGLMQDENRTFDIAALNFPGCGGSTYNEKITIQRYIDIAHAFLNYLPDKEFSVIGHSLGGLMAASVNDEPRVKNIMLMAPINPYIRDGASLKGVIAKLLPQTIKEAKDSYMQLIQNPNKKTYYDNKENGAKYFLSNAAKVGTRFLYMVKNEMINVDFLSTFVAGVFHKANKIAFALYGDKDKFSPTLSQDKFYKEYNIKSHKLINCGHAPMYEYPEITYKMILKLIEK